MIYVVEDEKNIRDLIVYSLKVGGFDAKGFEMGSELFSALDNLIPRLILLDIMLPIEDGITILKKIKNKQETKNIPVIMLTAKSSEYDKVLGLDNGADDYITKPFGVMELISRVKAVLRRSEKLSSNDEPTKYCINNLTLDTDSHTVLVDKEPVMLTYKEFKLLEILIKNRGIVMQRQTLLNEIWGYDFEGESRTLDSHIRSLRNKLGKARNIIETVRNVGYKIGDIK